MPDSTLCAMTLPERIGAGRMVVVGTGHEIQFTGQPLNGALQNLWRLRAAIDVD